MRLCAKLRQKREKWYYYSTFVYSAYKLYVPPRSGLATINSFFGEYSTIFTNHESAILAGMGFGISFVLITSNNINMIQNLFLAAAGS